MNYYVTRIQLLSAVKGNDRYKRRINFRGVTIGMCLMFASLYILLFLGLFDWVYELFR